jgi:hypothetical protein
MRWKEKVGKRKGPPLGVIGRTWPSCSPAPLAFVLLEFAEPAVANGRQTSNVVDGKRQRGPCCVRENGLVDRISPCFDR